VSTGFTVTLPGQPPSVNHTYEIARKRAKDRTGGPVLDLEGRPRTYTSLVKKPSVKKYQADISLILKAAKPTGFAPKGKVIVVYDLLLSRSIDADNVAKAVNDVLAGVLGINDKHFMSVTRDYQLGFKDPCIKLTVLDADHWAVQVVAK
jgi:hypothetical protein